MSILPDLRGTRVGAPGWWHKSLPTAIKLSSTLPLVFFLIVSSSAIGCAKPETTARGPQNPSESKGTLPRLDFAVAGKILFEKAGGLFVWSNGATRRLGDQRLSLGSPAWSPDGRKIAAVVVGQNHSDLVILNASGGMEKQITKNVSNVRVQDSSWSRRPVWSPDGSKIVYASDLGTDRLMLWMVNADGSAARRVQVSPSGDGDIDTPTWSPDGKRIAFAAYWSGASQIHVYTLASSSLKRITDGREGAYDPAWSSDGSLIAYTSRVDGKNDVWVADPDGKASNRVTFLDTARAPAWYPEGNVLAFLAIRDNVFDLFATKLSVSSGGPAVDASEPKRLTRGEGIDATSGVSWSAQ